ncbi:hypothetical protein [Paracoccus sp. (in: a-proteobacteria)]|uniref:hypothetical protein n=1 Tax=Paracoccus sp. TaxID=267 RepID=UPI003A83F784
MRQINALEGRACLIRHTHDVYLRDLPQNGRYFFSIRHPISRFYSGFYSRKRKGQPMTYSEWTTYDEHAFGDFEDANDLAEALFQDGPLGVQATAAIKSIRHTAQNQVDWFSGCGSFLYVREPVWIIRQEHFADDLGNFLKAAGFGHLTNRVTITGDTTRAHASDYSATPPLSDKARENLGVWYAQDIAFYRMCEFWLEEMAAQ